MFQCDEKYLNEEVSIGGSVVNKSGVYLMKITGAELRRGYNSQSEGINLNLETEDGHAAWLNLYYKDKSGQVIQFQERNLNHLCYLIDTNPVLAPDNKINNFIGKQVMVGLKVGTRVKNDGNEGYDFQLQGFFDPRTGQTAKEKLSTVDAKIITQLKERYANAEEVVLKPSNNPPNKNYTHPNFGPANGQPGYYPVNNEDIPF